MIRQVEKQVVGLSTGMWHEMDFTYISREKENSVEKF